MPNNTPTMPGKKDSKVHESFASPASYISCTAPSTTPVSHGSSKEDSPRVWTPVSRVGVTRKKLIGYGRKQMVLVIALFVIFLYFLSICHAGSKSTVRRPAYSFIPRIGYNNTHDRFLPFQPPEPVEYRFADTIDTFSSYKYRNTCNISSLDLHSAFSPLCTNRKDLIQAISGGGRIGFDAPYMPRACDMRWFSTEEACEILGRFEKVIILGDSMMRHVIGSINVLIRKDLGYGAVTDWNFSPEERRDCFCNYQFNVKACSIQGIFRTSDVVKNDPESVSCPVGSIDVMIEQMVRFPIPSEELARLRSLLPARKPSKPYVFVLGHGLWNDLDLQATLDWLDTILQTIVDQAPWLAPNSPSPPQTAGSPHHEKKRETGFFPKLILTPNAAGKKKPDEWIQSQGNKALMVFEESVKVEAERRGLEHLGTWNMSIQSNKYDGVHVDLKGNLIKAMMVLNWLNMLEVDKF